MNTQSASQPRRMSVTLSAGSVHLAHEAERQEMRGPFGSTNSESDPELWVELSRDGQL